MPRPKKTQDAAEVKAPALTFNEADRDQYGGDQLLIESRRKKDGTLAPRQKAVNEGTYGIREGDLIYLTDPAKKMHFALVHVDNASPWSVSEVTERLEGGYRFCAAKDFNVRETKRHLWAKNAAGNLSHMGLGDKALMPMWIPWEEYLRNQKREQAPSDDIQVSMDERLKLAAEESRRNSDGPYRYNNVSVDVSTTTETRFVPDRD